MSKKSVKYNKRGNNANIIQILERFCLFCIGGIMKKGKTIEERVEEMMAKNPTTADWELFLDKIRGSK